MPRKVNTVNIDLQHDNSKFLSCCRNISVFQDEPLSKDVPIDIKNSTEDATNVLSEQIVWFQSKMFFKGFKCTFTNKTCRFS